MNINYIIPVDSRKLNAVGPIFGSFFMPKGGDTMSQTISFDYFYGGQSDAFSYYRIPRLLITGQQFKGLSTDAKLLYGLLLCSGNDAAEALADGCGGTASFVRRMNGLAGELGMEDTSFENPSGLDGQAHYSTARDMARLAAYAAGNHTFVRLCSTRSVTIGGPVLQKEMY